MQLAPNLQVQCKSLEKSRQARSAAAITSSSVCSCYKVKLVYVLRYAYNGVSFSGSQSSLSCLPCSQPVAFELGIPPEDIIADLIIANHLLFAISGEYTGFLATEATSRSGGKVVMISFEHRQKLSSAFPLGHFAICSMHIFCLFPAKKLN